MYATPLIFPMEKISLCNRPADGVLLFLDMSHHLNDCMHHYLSPRHFKFKPGNEEDNI